MTHCWPWDTPRVSTRWRRLQGAETEILPLEKMDPKVIVEGGFTVDVKRVSGSTANRFGRGDGATWPIVVSTAIPINKVRRCGFLRSKPSAARILPGRPL